MRTAVTTHRALLDGSRGIVIVLLALPQAALAQGQPLTEAHAGKLVAAAVAQTRSSVTYDGSYRRIGYPGGDVPETIGVCTDVVIRAYRRVGVDLQVEVHEDMTRAFRSYPQLWGLSRPDPNIDHRRVPNLQAFLSRAGAGLPVSRDAGAYRAGDLVDMDAAAQPPAHRHRHGGTIADGRAAHGAQHRARA